MGNSVGELEQLVLLAILRLQESGFGAAVQREITERTGRSVSLGAVYSALIRLEDKGLLTSHIGEPVAERGGRRRRVYRVEPAGRQAVARALSDLREMSRGLNPRLGMP